MWPKCEERGARVNEAMDAGAANFIYTFRLDVKCRRGDWQQEGKETQGETGRNSEIHQ